MRFTTQWRAAFRVKSFKAVVIRRKSLGGGGGVEGRGGGRTLKVTGGRATSQRCYLGVGVGVRFCSGRAAFWCGPERP